jgi:ribosomal protein L37AE/L43A
MIRDKKGNLYCKRGFEVSSNTGFKKCPSCKFYPKSHDTGCVASQAGAMVVKALGFEIKPKKRIYRSNLDYYQCQVCPAKSDKEFCDKIGKTTHCGKPFILKRGYVMGNI